MLKEALIASKLLGGSGGGGGSSDFRTITVTFVPIIEGSPTIYGTSIAVSTGVYYDEPINPPEFSYDMSVTGTAVKIPVPTDFSRDNYIACDSGVTFVDSDYNFYGTQFIGSVQSIEGNAYLGSDDERLIIEGDCTITILARPM